MNDITKQLSALNGVSDKVYGQTVDHLIRERYSLWDELAILRQRDEKPEEYAAYNAYCEECKKQAKLEIYGEE